VTDGVTVAVACVADVRAILGLSLQTGGMPLPARARVAEEWWSPANGEKQGRVAGSTELASPATPFPGGRRGMADGALQAEPQPLVGLMAAKRVHGGGGSSPRWVWRRGEVLASA
jgi:hypothetical protein